MAPFNPLGGHPQAAGIEPLERLADLVVRTSPARAAFAAPPRIDPRKALGSPGRDAPALSPASTVLRHRRASSWNLGTIAPVATASRVKR